jgi:hypothetical protein
MKGTICGAFTGIQEQIIINADIMHFNSTPSHHLQLHFELLYCINSIHAYN